MDALITNIQGYSIHDGPGIRTVVFLKGCPMKCAWCANPECISFNVQTGFIKNLCTGCLRCRDACGNGAINSAGDALHRIDYSLCDGCGKCVEACYYNALVRYGKPMSAPDVYREVSRDKIFYEDGGGVTVSGGEPLAHACFVKELFELCKEGGISTCLETSGFADNMNLEMLLPLTDHILFDIKLLNSEKHQAYTGQPNGQILENAKVAAQSGVDIVFRIPLIPKVNDDGGNIAETAKFIKGIVAKPQVQLMPYHRMGDSKYTALNITNVMREVDTMPPESVEAVRRRFEDSGVECSISR